MRRFASSALLSIALSLIGGAVSSGPLAQPASTDSASTASGNWTQALAASTLNPADLGLRRRVHGPVLENLPPANPGEPVRVVLSRQPLVVALFPIDVARAAVAAGRAPKVGDHIGVLGVVGEYKGELQVTVASSDDVVKLDAAQFASLGAGPAPERRDPMVRVDEVVDFVGQRITVTAPIAEYKAPWNERAPHTLVLAEGDAKVDVVFWSDIGDRLCLEALTPKSEATVAGMAQLYRDRLQVRLAGADKLLVDGRPILKSADAKVPETPLAKDAEAMPAPSSATDGRSPISAAESLVGQPITVVATVTSLREAWSERAPNILTVSDESGSIDVVYWSQVKDKLAPGLAAEGSRLRISGIVNQHKGRTQIKVTDASRIVAAR